MTPTEKLLRKWINSVAVMHFAHHEAATRWQKRHVMLTGVLGTALTAVVGTSGFAALADSTYPWAGSATLIFSTFVAVVGAVNIGMDFRGLAQRHHAAATAFQGLRREMEEELARLPTGGQSDSFQHLRDRWTSALEPAPRLARDIHDHTRMKVTAREKEAAARDSRDVCLEWSHEG